MGFSLSIFSSPVNAILKTKTVAVVVAPPGNPTDTTNGRDQHKYKDWISTTTYRGIVLVLNHVRRKGKRRKKKGGYFFISNMVSNKLLGLVLGDCYFPSIAWSYPGTMRAGHVWYWILQLDMHYRKVGRQVSRSRVTPTLSAKKEMPVDVA